MKAPEKKRRLIAAVKGGTPVAEARAALSIPRSTAHRWLSQAQEEAPPAPASPAPSVEEDDGPTGARLSLTFSESEPVEDDDEPADVEVRRVWRSPGDEHDTGADGGEEVPVGHLILGMPDGVRHGYDTQGPDDPEHRIPPGFWPSPGWGRQPRSTFVPGGDRLIARDVDVPGVGLVPMTDTVDRRQRQRDRWKARFR
jgi:transposase-like protein